MAEKKLLIRELSVETVKLILPYLETKKIDKHIKNQLSRSSTSVGANISESTYAASKKDFINKLRIALKETNESLYWFDLIINSQPTPMESKILQNLKTLRFLLYKSINTASKSLLE